MEKINVGYKVVRKEGGKLYSAYTFGSAAIQYRSKKWVSRKVDRNFGPLAVFSSLESAINFSGTSDLVYKCYFIKSRAKTLYRKVPGNVGLIRKTNLPAGTLLADKVKLLKRMN